MFPTAHIFGHDIGMYGLMLIVGAVLAFLLGLTLKKLKRKLKHDYDKYGDFSNAFLIAIAGAAVGAVSLRPIMKIFEVITHWDKYGQVTANVLVRYIFGEIVFYGGLIGGLTALLLYCRSYKVRALPLLDLGAPAAALGHCVGRIGCLLGGCCYGKEVSAAGPFNGNPFVVVYPPAQYTASATEAALLSAPPNIPLLNIPLMESMFLLLLCAVLSAIFLRIKRDGICFSIYFIIYSVWRFVIEFWRGDTVRGVYALNGTFGISTSQCIALALFAVGVAVLARTARADF